MLSLWTMFFGNRDIASTTTNNPTLTPEIAPGFLARSYDLPTRATFAGEPVPLEYADVRERLDREIHVNSYFHSSTIFLIKRANQWLPAIAEILAAEGIPEDMKYIAVIESGLQNVISPSKAVGFWQILRPTAKELGLEVNNEVDERYDPIKSTYAAAAYLRESHQKFGTWTNAAASYNVGRRGLSRVMEQQKVDNYYFLDINEETSRYIFRAIALKLILDNPKKYGFEIAPEHLYELEPLEEIEVTETIDDLAAWAIDQGINYKLLVRYNPWLRQNKLTIRNGESYTIRLPKKE